MTGQENSASWMESSQSKAGSPLNNLTLEGCLDWVQTHDVKPKDPKSLPLFGKDDFFANNSWYSITRGEGRHVELVLQERRQLISDGQLGSSCATLQDVNHTYRNLH
jgi:hypothetical protein